MRALRGPGGLRAAAADAGSLLTRLARGCASAAAKAVRRSRSDPADAALLLYAATLAARGLAAAARGAGEGAAVGKRIGLASARRAADYVELIPMLTVRRRREDFGFCESAGGGGEERKKGGLI